MEFIEDNPIYKIIIKYYEDDMKYYTIIFNGTKNQKQNDNEYTSSYYLFEDDDVNAVKMKLLITLRELVLLQNITYYSIHLFYLSNMPISSHIIPVDNKDMFSYNLKKNIKQATNNEDDDNSKDVLDVITNKKYLTKKHFDKNLVTDTQILSHTVDPYDLQYDIDDNVRDLRGHKDTIIQKNLHEHTIFCVDAGSVFQFHTQKSLKFNNSKIIKMYFPLMISKGVLTKENYSDKIRELQKSSSNILSKGRKQLDNIHEINKRDDQEQNTPPHYSLLKMSVMLTNIQRTFIQLDDLFRFIRTSKEIPLVKYNTSKSNDNFYRVFTEGIQNNREVPYIRRTKFNKVEKMMLNMNSVSVYIDGDDNSKYTCVGEVFANGNIQMTLHYDRTANALHVENKERVDFQENIKRKTNTLIRIVNKFLIQSGISLQELTSFDDPLVEIVGIDYVFFYESQKSHKIPKLDCLSPVFTLEDNKSKKVTNFPLTLKFMRVNDKILNSKGNGISVELKYNQHVIPKRYEIYVSNISSFKYLRILYNYIHNVFNVIEKKTSCKSIKGNDTNSIPDEVDAFLSEDNENSDDDDDDDLADLMADEEYDDIGLNNDELDDDDDDDDDEFGTQLETEPPIDNDLDYDELGLSMGEITPEDESMSDRESMNSYSGGNKRHNLYIRMKAADPELFQTYDKKKKYGTACQSGVNKQPVIITKNEKDALVKDHSDTLDGDDNNTKFLKSPKSDEHYYICPKFWCDSKRISLNESQVTFDPEDKNKEHKDRRWHTIDPNLCPGEVTWRKIKHPNKSDGFDSSYPSYHNSHQCLPCCVQKDKPEKKKEKCPEHREDNANNESEEIEREESNTLNRKNVYLNLAYETFGNNLTNQPFTPKGRYGYLPSTLYSALHHTKLPPTETTEEFLVRYGVGESLDKQSFLHCMAMYTKQSLEQLKDTMKKHITLEHFMRLNNGSLVSIFDDGEHIDPHKEMKLFEKVRGSKENKDAFVRIAVNAFNKFMTFLMSDDTTIDHTYMWDIFVNCDTIFKEKLNLVIVSAKDGVHEKHIDVFCPSSQYSNANFEHEHNTLLLFKRESTYEIILKITKGAKTNTMEDTVSKSTNIMNPVFFEDIKQVYNDKCSPLRSVEEKDTITHFHNEISRSYIEGKINTNSKYTVKHQVVNYNGKCHGLIIKGSHDTDKEFMVPIYPSYMELNQSSRFIDDADNYLSLQDTIDMLSKFQKWLKEDMYLIKYKVGLDSEIVGVVTKGNLFVETLHISTKRIRSEKYETKTFDHHILIPGRNIESNIILRKTKDHKNTIHIRKMRLENMLYIAFRSRIKKLVNSVKNRDMKKQMMIIKNPSHGGYVKQFKSMMNLLKELMKKEVKFVKTSTAYSDDFIKKLPLNLYESEHYIDGLYLKLPETNLVSGRSNETFYYERVTDEILRNTNIDKYIFTPEQNLLSTPGKFFLQNEMVIPQSLFTSDYYQDIDYSSTRDKTLMKSHDTAKPITKKKYDNTFKKRSQTQGGNKALTRKKRVVSKNKKKPRRIQLNMVQK